MRRQCRAHAVDVRTASRRFATAHSAPEGMLADTSPCTQPRAGSQRSSVQWSPSSQPAGQRVAGRLELVVLLVVVGALVVVGGAPVEVVGGIPVVVVVLAVDVVVVGGSVVVAVVLVDG